MHNEPQQPQPEEKPEQPPCVDCQQPTVKTPQGDDVCNNPECFLYRM